MPPASSSPTDSNSSNGSDLSSSPPLGSSGSYLSGKFAGNGSNGGITLYGNPVSSSSILGLSHHHHQVGLFLSFEPGDYTIKLPFLLKTEKMLLNSSNNFPFYCFSLNKGQISHHHSNQISSLKGKIMVYKLLLNSPPPCKKEFVKFYSIGPIFNLSFSIKVASDAILKRLSFTYLMFAYN